LFSPTTSPRHAMAEVRRRACQSLGPYAPDRGLRSLAVVAANRRLWSAPPRFPVQGAAVRDAQVGGGRGRPAQAGQLVAPCGGSEEARNNPAAGWTGRQAWSCAGKVAPEVLAAKMANTIDQNKELQATYLPNQISLVRLADVAGVEGRRRLRARTNLARKVETKPRKS
jgi:hypothetical protein